ncbi:hypothetical protein [Verrucomicrobium sp. BvORR106]|uniref:hypothetical protein n=1 Tax=Verrucomicrobium sp. BvORR106 TaxID=1403819 RepID=UPI00056FCE7F|nr:hypothetical protein [Verrucomicrobium sp. BvORR106]
MPSFQEKDTGAGKQIGTSPTQKLGFFGKAPVVQPAGVTQAVATDAASVIVLANALRSSLVDLGLIKGAA